VLDNMSPAQDKRAGRASDSVSQAIALAIRSGELPVGGRLPAERELTRRFGVSRFVIREAIADLSNKGFLLTRPGFRPVVARPDADMAMRALGEFVGRMIGEAAETNVWNLYETRIFVEAGLARHAALHARKEDIQALQAALSTNRQAIGRRGEFERTDAAFHHVLYTIPRNPIYPALHRAYVQWLQERWARIESTPEINMMNYVGHEAICAAIVDRDPDRAEEALRRHLGAAWEHVRTSFAFNPSTAKEEQTEET
jgi:DNA-binding FadR family transcriptional regulator